MQGTQVWSLLQEGTKWGNEARALQLLSARDVEPVLQNKRGHGKEESAHRNYREAMCSNKDLTQPLRCKQNSIV